MVCYEIMDYSGIDLVNDTLDDSEMIEDSDSDDLQFRQVAGGSITDFPPIFSQDGENILLVWNNVVKVFSVSTGSWVRDLERTDADLVSIDFDPTNPKILIGCTTNGEVVSWKWKSGVKHFLQKLTIPEMNFRVMSFNVFEGQEGDVEAVVVYYYNVGMRVKLDVFKLSSGESLNGFPDKFNQLTPQFFKVAMGTKQKMFALIQRHILYVGNLSTGKRKYHFNLGDTFMTAVAIHPELAVVATGDKYGKVVLWINPDTPQPLTSIYHWHSAAVNCIAFSQSGSYFYSGGTEYVLVKWTQNRPEMKSFLPRMRGSPVHIVVGQQNQQIAVSLSDNGIQLLDANMHLKALIQNFSHIADDNTEEDPFPAGLRINPRNNCIVLNGRVGHLQFFSPYTKSFLYDIDITGENQLAPEPMSIIYSTRVTRVAISMNWMATAECWNDHEHFPQTKLKFWYFDTEKQMYSLRTNIFMPHEKAITALEFSGIYTTDRVTCASAGGDNYLITWTWDSARWINSGRIKYKNYPIKSLAFSQDASLLAAGFGSVCVLYTTDQLTIKGVFSAPSCFDGGVGKLSIFPPTPQLDANGDVVPPKRAKRQDSSLPLRPEVVELAQSFLDNDSPDLAEFIKKETNCHQADVPTPRPNNLDDQELFKKILSLKDLNVDQKLEILRKLDLHCRVSPNSRKKLLDYVEKSGTLSDHLDEDVKKSQSSLSENYKYSASAQLLTLNHRNTKLSRIFSDPSQNKPLMNGMQDSETPQESSLISEPAQIHHVTFSSGEFAHLLIVATGNRVLIWNLLTMRLKNILRASASALRVDPVTGLLAVFSKFNNLYVFLPNTPIPLYHRHDLPGIHDAIWIPRQDPKATSLNVDWQASSQLFFLSDRQELLHLTSESAEEESPMMTFLSEAGIVNNYTPFGAMIAKQVQQKVPGGRPAGTLLPAGILGKSNVNELINSIPHAMAPSSLLSKSFLKSLLIASTSQAEKKVESHEKSDKQSATAASAAETEGDAKIEERLENMRIFEMKSQKKEKINRDKEVTMKESMQKFAKTSVQFKV
ncbi:WD repeat-containing protein 75 [Sergentomyia squamirostris]